MTTMKHEPREAWQLPSEPVTGPPFPGWDALTDGIVVHYPGYNGKPTSRDKVISRLRTEQHDYVTNRGYSLGYNFIIDPFGTEWEVRGTTFRNAANSGGKVGYNVNDRSISVQVQTDLNGIPTQAQWDSLAEFVEQCHQLAGRTLPVRPHSHWEWTSCPGDPLRKWCFEYERDPTDPQPPGDDMAQFRGIKLRVKDKNGKLYADQILAFTLGNPEMLKKIGADDDTLYVAQIEATRAQIEGELGFKLTP